MIRRVSHIGIAVPRLEEATGRFERVLGARSVLGLESPRHAVRAAFIPVGQTEIELIQPTTSDTGVGRFVARRGSGLHHLCLEVDDLGTELGRLSAQGARLIDREPQASDVDGPFQAYAWVHQDTLGGVLLELVQCDR